MHSEAASPLTASDPSFIASVSRFGRGHRSRIQMIPADHDRRLQLSRRHHLVEHQPRPVPVAKPDPADPGRQTLEGNPLRSPCQASGAGAAFSGKSRFIAASVLRISSGSPDRAHPAEGADPLAEERAGCRRARSPGRRRHSPAPRPSPPAGCCCRNPASGRRHSRSPIIASTWVLHRGPRRDAPPPDGSRLLLRARQSATGPPRRAVAMQGIMGRGLVGHDVGARLHRPSSGPADLGERPPPRCPSSPTDFASPREVQSAISTSASSSVLAFASR